jgi:hypothetical protein
MPVDHIQNAAELLELGGSYKYLNIQNIFGAVQPNFGYDLQASSLIKS